MLQLPRSAALVARLEVVERAGSTNADLVRAAGDDPEAWPAPAVLVTDHQTAGRGRQGRTWSAGAGDSLAISVLLDPGVPRERLGWLSLAAGAAMTRALRGLGVEASAKWPNDVLIGGRKVCGVLAEALPDGRRVVVGAGLNHAGRAADLPVPTATSLAVEGGPTDPDLLLAAYLTELLALSADLAAAGGDPDRGLREIVRRVSGTIGRRVRVSLPDGSALEGEAVDVDSEGRIVVDTTSIHGRTAVPAGDVEHLRYT
ncbi:biotin--[acetyl-CoA-carboxylase] ligase [Amnibacterium endophyticum]|uniref:biotin--[biotin carboxyl-carrier protein] ligase n=1 Tax=Amnibacterium endophyticum TaxID=2109337 RepID=A0ABW4LCT0_9MICO